MKSILKYAIVAMLLVVSTPIFAQLGDKWVKIDNLYYLVEKDGNVSVSGFGGNYDSGVPDIRGAVSIPEKVSINGKQYKVTWVSTFLNCENITSVSLPSSIIGIADNAFQGCKRLSSINFPEKLEVIGPNCFKYCSSLQKCDLPESLLEIYAFAFVGCTSLKSITLPSKIELIDVGAFAMSDNIRTITLRGSDPTPIYDNAFSASVYKNARLIVPENSIDSYRNAKGWDLFFKDNPTGVEEVSANISMPIVEIYDASGKKLKTMRKGLNIVQTSGGKVYKIAR